MAKKGHKPLKKKDLQADYDRVMQLGSLPTSSRRSDIDIPRLGRMPHLVVVRTYTTYSAYEDPITEE